MSVHDFIEKNVTKMKNDHLADHHYELTMEVAYAAREVSDLQSKIMFLNSRLEEVESELESREAKENGKVN